MQTFLVYTDGASRGNPGPSAAGFVLKDAAGKVVQICGKKLGVQTNNFAEYSAIHLALETLSENYSGNSLVFRLDSELAVKQLRGEYKVKNPVIAGFVDQIRTLEKNFSRVEYNHVVRNQNKEADKLVNDVLDGKHV